MFMQIFFPLRLFALQGRHLSKVCSLGKSSEFCSLTSPIGKSFCLPFPWRKSGTNFCYCLRQFVITRQAACLRQEETLPQGPISGNFSPMIIGLNGSIFTPVLQYKPRDLTRPILMILFDYVLLIFVVENAYMFCPTTFMLKIVK